MGRTRVLTAKAEVVFAAACASGGGPKRSRTSQEPVCMRQLRVVVTVEVEQHRRAAETNRRSARVRAK